MNMLGAMVETVRLAHIREMAEAAVAEESLSLRHLEQMTETMVRGGFSDAKMGRWLGWAQAAVVAAGCATLDEMKMINLSHSDVG